MCLPAFPCRAWVEHINADKHCDLCMPLVDRKGTDPVNRAQETDDRLCWPFSS